MARRTEKERKDERKAEWKKIKIKEIIQKKKTGEVEENKERK